MRFSILVVILAALSPVGCAYSHAGTVDPGTNKITLPDGSVYEGELKNGLFNGKGELRWGNGAIYQGDFQHGLMHGKGSIIYGAGDKYSGDFNAGMRDGQGVFIYRNGDVYRGGFKDNYPSGQGLLAYGNGNVYRGRFRNGQFEGKGTFIKSNGERYKGDFSNGTFSGKGIQISKEGDIYEGEFESWKYHGQGVLRFPDGERFRGRFVEDSPQGKGEHYLPDGSYYKGDFKDWFYHGEGIYIFPDGNRYEGDFKDSLYHGQGAFYYSADGEMQKVEGQWEHGEYIEQNIPPLKRLEPLNAEKVLYDQYQMLARSLGTIEEGRGGVPDLYFLGFGGYGEQDVFMKEVLYAERMFTENYGAKNRALSLINNRKLVQRQPIATVTNMERALQGFAARMNPEEDILFLFLSSHGYATGELSVILGDLPLQDLSATALAELLRQAGIKWKVVVVSSCYSGGFVEPLKDDYTMIITSAKADRTSFGCSDEADFTYFGRSFFEHSLMQTRSFVEAFDKARSLIRDLEENQDFEHSYPQITYSQRIVKKLADWRSTLFE